MLEEIRSRLKWIKEKRKTEEAEYIPVSQWITNCKKCGSRIAQLPCVRCTTKESVSGKNTKRC